MITDISPTNLLDGYKVGHRPQYPDGTEYVYSNLTARNSRIKGLKHVAFDGLTFLVKEYLIERWNKNFFEQPKEKVIKAFKRRIDNYMGPDLITVDHIAALHDLGYLPIKIKALPEGSLIPIGVPSFTIVNTHKNFSWLTNSLETLSSTIMWKPITSLTTAALFRQRFDRHAKKVGYGPEIVQWQAHDFSMRGMSGPEDAMMSGASHLKLFTGTDCVPAIDFLEMYYNADSDKELIGGTVPATEHSVMCMGEKESEIETFRRLITVLYATGIVSIVSDTWDYWKVMTEYLVTLKEEILARDGRVVIRPDSGDPVKIICGDPDAKEEHIRKGSYEVMWDIFGGHIHPETGYKVLNTKIGLIYGDSITLERQDQILNQLEAKGFSASNLVLGIGSYTYEYVTRDTHGMAIKATWGQVNGEPREIFKDPKTDDGTKKSAKGLLQVYLDEDGEYRLKDQCTPEEEEQGELKVVFENGKLIKDYTLSEVRETIAREITQKLGYYRIQHPNE